MDFLKTINIKAITDFFSNVAKFFEGLSKNKTIQQIIKLFETIGQGFENAFKSFYDTLKGIFNWIINEIQD